MSSLVGSCAHIKKTVEPISEGKHESFANAFLTGGKTFLALDTLLTLTNLLKNISVSLSLRYNSAVLSHTSTNSMFINTNAQTSSQFNNRMLTRLARLSNWKVERNKDKCGGHLELCFLHILELISFV